MSQLPKDGYSDSVVISHDSRWTSTFGAVLALLSITLGISSLVVWGLALSSPDITRYRELAEFPLVMSPAAAWAIVNCALGALFLHRKIKSISTIIFSLTVGASILSASRFAVPWWEGWDSVISPEIQDVYNDEGMFTNQIVVMVLLIGISGLISNKRVGFAITNSVILVTIFLISIFTILGTLYGEEAPAFNQYQGLSVIFCIAVMMVAVSLAAARPHLMPMSALAHKSTLISLGMFIAMMIAIPFMVQIISNLLNFLDIERPDQWARISVIVVIAFAVVRWSLRIARRKEWTRLIEVVSGSLIILDEQDKIIEVNQGTLDVLGYSNESDLVGRAISEIIPYYNDLYGSSSVLGSTFGKSLDRGMTPHNKRRQIAYSVSGTEIPIDVSYRVFYGKTGSYSVVSMRDVTSQIEIEQEKSRYEKMIMEASDKSLIGQVLIDSDGNFVRVNKSFASMLGYQVDELVGRSIRYIAPNNSIAATDVRFKDILSGERDTLVHEEEYVTRAGNIVILQFNIRLLDGYQGERVISAQVVDMTAQREAESRASLLLSDLEFQSSHDILTRLLNRRAFLSQLDEFLEESRYPKRRVAVLYCDLDNFKPINDVISHEAGDQVLIEIADRFRSIVRESDLICRLGGDEFVIALSDIPSVRAASDTAEKVRAAVLNEEFVAGDQRVNVGVSIGITMSGRNSNAQQLLREADVALHHAKESGRNRWEIFNNDMRSEMTRRLNVAEELRDALVMDRIHAWFQPIVRMEDRKIMGYETLARWIGYDATVTAAGEWIDIAEENGLVLDIGQRMIYESIHRLSSLPEDQYVAVNISSSQLALPNFSEMLDAALKYENVNPSRLVLEITEHVALKSTDSTQKMLSDLHSIGVSLYLDDFGTGYSSLTHLRSSHINGIKLDYSFTSDITSEETFALVVGLASFAQYLNLNMVAEGVSTREQEELLKSAGWKYGQGWLYGYPEAPPTRANVLERITPGESIISKERVRKSRHTDKPDIKQILGIKR